MDPQPDYDALDGALSRCGADWTVAQCHGLLTGRLAAAGRRSAEHWRQQVLENAQAGSAPYVECERMLAAVCEETHRQLAERQSAFEPLLPGDDAGADVRTAALAHWCEGFLHGLVSVKDNPALRKRLATEPLDDIIRDMLQISRAGVDEDADDESNEVAYAELVEYLRIAAQLAYEELTDIRKAA